MTSSRACCRSSRRNEREITERFAERYRAAEAGVTREIELAVIGGDWGANGYATVAQADQLARVTRAWIGQWDRRRADLVAAFGEQDIEERQADRRTELRAIEDGLLSRSLFTAVR